MKKENTVWMNHYDRRGNMSDSVPADITEVMDILIDLVHRYNTVMKGKEDWLYKQVSTFRWENAKGMSIRVESFGNPLLYIKNLWVAISANYPINAEDINTDEDFIYSLYKEFGTDEKKIEDFAESFYTLIGVLA